MATSSRPSTRAMAEIEMIVDVRAIAGISYNDMLVQSLTFSKFSEGSREGQDYGTISQLISLSSCDELIDAVRLHRFWAHSISFLKKMANRDEYQSCWPEYVGSIIPMWMKFMATSVADDSLFSYLAKESLDHGLFFVLERWLAHAHIDKRNLDTGGFFTMLNIGALYAKDEPTRTDCAQILHQCHVIETRLLSRPGVDKLLLEAWSNCNALLGEAEFRPLLVPFMLDPGPFCARLGCDGIEHANMCCAGCKMQFYCSRECQRSDWKFHKPHCKKSSSGSK
ncbi:hypothetical protein DL93DRAFT_133154 [Clavulina sp. PMI_390]|nr:hypothetical protein DL93DRAFT_133154 [Clavulina sp. PMI_390]